MEWIYTPAHDVDRVWIVVELPEFCAPSGRDRHAVMRLTDGKRVDHNVESGGKGGWYAEWAPEMV